MVFLLLLSHPKMSIKMTTFVIIMLKDPAAGDLGIEGSFSLMTHGRGKCIFEDYYHVM